MLTFFGCGAKPNVPEVIEPEHEIVFYVNVDNTPGTLILDSARKPVFQTRPRVVLELFSEDTAANYVIEYTIDDSETKTAKGLWHGKTKDISSDFFKFNSYGIHSLKGDAYNVERPGERVHFEEEVWIKYAPAKVEGVYAYTYEDSLDLTQGITVQQGDGGVIHVYYSPKDTYLHVEASVEEDGPVSLNQDKQENTLGVYSIPFRADGLGHTVLTVRTSNGPDGTTYKYNVTCEDGGVVL